MRQEPFTAAIGFAVRVPHRSLVRLCVMLMLLMGTVLFGRLCADDWPAWPDPRGRASWMTRRCRSTGVPPRMCGGECRCPNGEFHTGRVGRPHLFDSGHRTQQRRTLMCFSSRDGKLLWQSGVVYDHREPTNAQNPYCAASPVTDGQHVIACFGSAGVYCYDFEGHELWHRDFGPVDSWHGSGSSPVIYRDLCILNYGPGATRP